MTFLECLRSLQVFDVTAKKPQHAEEHLSVSLTSSHMTDPFAASWHTLKSIDGFYAHYSHSCLSELVFSNIGIKCTRNSGFAGKPRVQR